MRSTTSSTVAEMPQLAYPGMKAIRNVAPAMPAIETLSMALRPCLSPKWENRMPPIGRTR